MTAVQTQEASPLSKEEYEQWVMEAHQMDQVIRQSLRGARGQLWMAAKAMHAFTEKTGWVAIGYDSLGMWLADPDVSMSRSTYYRMVQTWQEYAVLRGVDDETMAKLDLTKAHIALPALKRGDATVDEIVADVEVLGARDLREKYRGDSELLPTDSDGEIIDVNPGGETPEWAGPAPIDDDDDGHPLPNTNVGSVYVERGIAETLTVVLETVLDALGPPEAKRIGKNLRSQIEAVLALAHDEGLGDV